jgi:glycosyltransferase involved in cell wall biosynthesis
MQSNKQIEILMAVYNGEKYVKAQIDSILNQTYKNIHLSIRDNCSSDSTREIIAEYKNRHPQLITLLASQENVGIIGNFSALLDSANGDYVMFSDHDDVWMPDKIEKTMTKLLELEKKFGSITPILVHTDLQVVNKDLALIHSSFWKYSKLDPRKTALSRQLIHNQITGCTLMLNRALIELARPIPKKIVMHDWWLGICAAAFGKIGTVNESTMFYRQHNSNDTGAKKYSLLNLIKRICCKASREKMSKNRKLVYEQAREFLAHKHIDERSKEVLNAFIKFEDAVFLKKAYLMVKFGFYRVGILRNMAMLFRPKNLF